MLEQLEKSPNDPREYFTYKIKNNLNIFIVHDKTAIISAIGMHVKVGYISDPDNVSGCAHFCEHMLFNGTKKYPNENDFMDYVKKNGGHTNAFTTHNNTFYYYNIASSSLFESLDKFGQFFISPLMSPDSVNREKDAVDSEHQNNLNNDAWRLRDILRFGCTKNHPFNKFGTGSRKSLDVPNIDKIVKDFYEKYYSSDNMILFIVTNNMEGLVDRINDIFNEVPQRNPIQKMKYSKIFDSPKTIKVVTIDDIYMINFNWEIPSFHTIPPKSPNIFLSYILGNESKNSIHYILEQKNYILSSVVEINRTLNEICILTIEFKLTPEGFENRSQITKIVFDYIEMLKQSVNNKHLNDLYDEFKNQCFHKFEYLDKESPENTCMELNSIVSNTEIELKHIPSIMYAYDSYNNIKNNLIQVLNELTINNVIIVIGAKKFSIKKWLYDENYGTQYTISSNIDIAANFFKQLNLISQNKYSSLKKYVETINYDIPKKIQLSHKNINLFYHPINKYKNPTVCVNIEISIPKILENSILYTQFILYIDSILLEINDEKYLCHSADYIINITCKNEKIYIIVSGNRGKIYEVTNFIISSILDPNKLTSTNFIKTQYAIKMNNINIVNNSPYYRLSSYFNKNMCSKYYDNYDILKVIDNITYNDVRTIMSSVISSVSANILVSGNIKIKLAKKIADLLVPFSNIENTNTNIDFIKNLYKIPTKDNEKFIYSIENKHDKNSAMKYSIYIDTISYKLKDNWEKTICLLKILNSKLSTIYFDTLRTKEKFGYIVSGNIDIYGDKLYSSLYYGFAVQSPEKKSTEMIKRTNEFINDFENILKNIDVDEFIEIINGCIANISVECNNVLEESAYYMDQISKGYFSFTMKQDLIKTFKQLEKKDLITFYNQKFIKKKSIIVCIDGNI